MLIGDLHIHSRFSRATSRDCTPEFLELWARKKGIDILGTGDFTHPAWREELKEKLKPAEDGLYVLKEEYRLKEEGAPDSVRPRFVVTGEISSIYKKMDRVRKVHSLILLPGLEEAEQLAGRLELIGNIHSDGRPILGLDCRDLLEITLETCSRAIYIPAHIWTPHFSLFGAFSGFDRIEDCFGDLTPHIHALETGLSSDPPMNWRVSALDSYFLISNSDAHSPAKLGREATLFDMKLSYKELAKAVNEGTGLAGTIEFYPEEGKYHFDGHRKCGLCLSPQEARGYGNICPICGRKLTIGVLHRVEELADREEGVRASSARPFESLVPLPEVIAASLGVGAASKKVLEKYSKMLQKLGPEFQILRSIPVEDIRKAAGPVVAEGIERLRQEKVERIPGFDGEYGRISLISPPERGDLEGQISLFTPEEIRKQDSFSLHLEIAESLTEAAIDKATTGPGMEGAGKDKQPVSDGVSGADEELVLNAGQEEAVLTGERFVAVIAGPGAGKTRTLISHLLYLLSSGKARPSEITAVTFTNKAAEEMRNRLEQQPGGKRMVKKLHLGTFHSICSQLLADSGISFTIADEGLREELADRTIRRFGRKLTPGGFLREVSFLKTGAQISDDSVRITEEEFNFYQDQLREAGAMDYDDLLLETLKLYSEEAPKEASEQALEQAPEEASEQALEQAPEEASEQAPEEASEQAPEEASEQAPEEVSEQDHRQVISQPPSRTCFAWLMVDEFQDINPVQYELIQAWNRDGKELFVIGDPDQAIYGFRGSDERCFARLKEDAPQLKEIRLTANYRSTPEIIEAALAVINHNEGTTRRMEAAGAHGCPIRLVTAQDEWREAVFVAKEINRLIGGIDMLDVDEKENRLGRGVRSFSDIAVIYRTHRQAYSLEKVLRQEGIPYVVAGREDFLLEPKVRGALYFFRYMLHPKDTTAHDLLKRLVFSSSETGEEELSILYKKYEKLVYKRKPVKLLQEWAADIKAEASEAVGKLMDMAVCYDSMESFLHTLSFGEDGDIRRCPGGRFLADAVTLMTFHGSKGLEYPAVFLYGIRKGLLPLEMSGKSTDQAEERRLFYVGMTRAGEELILTTSGEESSFIGEMPEVSIARENAGKDKRPEEITQLSLFDLI